MSMVGQVILIDETELRAAGRRIADIPAAEDFEQAYRSAARFVFDVLAPLTLPEKNSAPIVLVGGDRDALGALPPRRMLIGRNEVAAMLGVSQRTIDAWRQSGRIPAPVIVEENQSGQSRIVRWSVPELERWIAAGCPVAETVPALARLRRRRRA